MGISKILVYIGIGVIALWALGTFLATLDKKTRTFDEKNQ